MRFNEKDGIVNINGNSLKNMMQKYIDDFEKLNIIIEKKRIQLGVAGKLHQQN